MFPTIVAVFILGVALIGFALYFSMQLRNQGRALSSRLDSAAKELEEWRAWGARINGGMGEFERRLGIQAVSSREDTLRIDAIRPLFDSLRAEIEDHADRLEAIDIKLDIPKRRKTWNGSFQKARSMAETGAAAQPKQQEAVHA